MSFLVQKVVGRALALNEIRGNVLRIGRGTQQQLRSDNPAVALDHALIEEDQAGYTITDHGSITGTYVNSKAVETQRLSKGDVIEIGDLRIEVQSADAGKPLFLRVSSTATRALGRGMDVEEAATPAAAGPAGGTLRAKRVDYAYEYRLQRPWFTRWSITAFLLIVTLAVVGQVTTADKQKAFMPGGVSSAHSRARDASGQPIGEKCDACHSAWNGVPSSRCSECHGKASHADNVAAELPCGECHMEHRGTTKLAVIADSRCVGCHSNLGAHMKQPDQKALAAFATITSFGGKHPDFTWPADDNTLKLNHKVHLAKGGIFNASGQRERLKCASCHKLVETRGKTDPAPISFEQHCHRCHRLTFDPRFPDTEVPHGAEPGLVYGFILQTYGGNSDIAGKSPEELRRILTKAPVAEPGSQAFINAEQVIKTKCSLCHEIRRTSGKLAAARPSIPTQWLDHANFSHGPHRNLECESCHSAAPQSTRTSDVLMPLKKDCTDCHGSRPLLGTARSASNCILCHDYHDRKQITTRVTALRPKVGGAVAQAAVLGGTGSMLTTILLLAIFVLLLVVLIPVGYALYQRAKPVPAEPAAPPRAAAAPQPPPFAMPASAPAAPAPAAAPAARAAAPQPAAPPKAPAPAPPPAAPAAAATEMINLNEMKKPAADAPQATEMVKWYGMLNCTGGPLEGQKFIIEEEGLYIGRDGSMSQVVINDSRVSKRHVRIMPRNGKVWAIDQNSTNGTFMGKAGGERISEVQLKRGDVIVLADNAATFTYQI